MGWSYGSPLEVGICASAKHCEVWKTAPIWNSMDRVTYLPFTVGDDPRGRAELAVTRIHGQPGVAPNGIGLHPVLSSAGDCRKA